MGDADASLRILFAVVLGAVVLERLFELWLSRRNASRVLARGGREAGAGHYPVMVLLHVAFFAALLAEVALLPTRPWPALAWSATVLVVAAMALRYWAIWSLGDRWNPRVLYEPERPPSTRGPYRLLRHPNYLAVALELFALPMIHGAWRTATLFSLLNLALLSVRVEVEEAVVAAGREARGGVP